MTSRGEMIEVVSRPHRANLVRWARERPDVLVLSADLTTSCEADGFRDAFAERFISLGMAEQNMMSFAAGLAREGYEPLVHTFGVFVCRRPFDQVAMSIAYPNLRVRLLGFLPGVVTPGGATHQAIEDLALMRALPNMTVLECGDATEVESVLDVAHAVDGPVYVRMLRGEVPRWFGADEPMQIGRARVLSDGDEVLLVSSGICTAPAIRAGAALARHSVGVRHLHVSTIKPFDDPIVADALATRSLRGVISCENHSIVGGLGSAVAEMMAEAGCGKRLVRLGLQDTFAHGASCDYLMSEYGIDAAAIVRATELLLGRRVGVTDDELSQTAGQREESRSTTPNDDDARPDDEQPDML